jgi:hypothetical protein
MTTSNPSAARAGRAVLVLIAALLLTACGAAGGPAPAGSIGASSPAASGADPGASADASAPSESGAPASDAPASTEPSTGAVDVDLATLLPTEVGGKTIDIELGTNPTSFTNLWEQVADAEAFLAGLGKTIDDVSLVYGTNSEDFPNLIYMTGYRVEGADGQALGRGMAEQLADRIEGLAVTDQTIAGRPVITLSAAEPTEGDVPHHFVVIGDTVVDVQANPPEWAEEAISKLPGG